jgi:hypothetical protein
MRRSVLLALLLFLALPVQAERFAVVAKSSTLGFGLDISKPFGERWAARIAFNGISFDRDIRETDVEYATDIDLRTAGLLLDWHPGGYAFRINGQDYAAADVGSLDGTIDFKAAAPYVGIGFGNAGKRGFKFTIDIGALYQSAPRVNLQVACANPAVCSQLQEDVQAEAARLTDELSDYRWWPVIGVGIGWAF